MPLHYVVGNPLRKRPPVVAADQNYWDFFVDFSGLPQGDELKGLIERAVAAREKDKRLGRKGEHDFAGKKIVEGNGFFYKRIGALLQRQLDVEPHRLPAALDRAFVGRLHDPRPSARDYRVAVFGEQVRELLGRTVVAVFVRKAGG